MNLCRLGHPRARYCVQVSRSEYTRHGTRSAHSKRSLTIVACDKSDAGVDPAHQYREKELSRREDQLWQRMELLLDREAELREQELASANRREAHLQSQVDMLLSILSNNQSEKSLPPGMAGNTTSQQEPPPRIADVLQTIQSSAANQSRGTFAEYSGDDDTSKMIEEALQEGPAAQARAGQPPAVPPFATGSGQATPAEQPSFAEEIQGVVDDVLKGRTDPLEGIDWSEVRVPKRQGSGTAGSAEAPAASPATPPSSPVEAPSSPVAPGTPGQASPASARGGAAPMSIADAMMSAATAAAKSGAGDGPVETEKAPKDGPPPLLNIGDDDIYWVAALQHHSTNEQFLALVDPEHALGACAQKALLEGGCYCGEDDEADFYFGAGTQSAVLTFQAIKKIPETGVSDEATWAALGIRSGADISGAGEVVGESPKQKDPAEDGLIWQQGDKAHDASAGGGGFGGLFDGLGIKLKDGSAEKERNGDSGVAEATAARPEGKPSTIQSARRREKPQYDKWPVLREGDGERAVHTLHVMLQQQGFHPDDEDTKWWMYGPTTVSALTTFQACSGLPETGVCDVATWLALLGDQAKPEDIDLVFSGDSDDEDMDQIAEGRVYLLGEQRWSKY